MGQTLLDFEGFHDWLADREISVRWDELRRDIVVAGLKGFTDVAVNDCAAIIVHDMIKRDFKGATQPLVENLLSLESRQNAFNPVIDLLNAAPPWDGIDRIRLFCDILGIQDDFSRILVRKWMIQAMELVTNDGTKSAAGVLTFVGEQDLGKSFAARQVTLPGMFRGGLHIDPRDRDSVMRATADFIVELGEAETTIRGDLERLKAFITNSYDRVRPPFGRRDINAPRRTSYIATVNSTRFLRDPTGNRRFWTIELSDVDVAALAEFDSVQLWQQMREVIRTDGDYRLTREELRQLNERNGNHETLLKGEAEIRDILDQAEAEPLLWDYKLITVVAFKQQHDVLRGLSAEQIGRVLDRLGIVQQRPYTNGHQIRARRLPVRKIDAFLRRA